MNVKPNESEIEEGQRNNRVRRQAKTEKRRRVTVGSWREEKHRNKPESGGSTHERQKLHRRTVCPVWETGLGFETIFSFTPSLHLCSYSRTPSSPAAILSTTRNPTLPPPFPFFLHAIQPKRCRSLSGRRGQEEGYGGS